jgi:quercetin dioxygenase-like cupin family protein
MVIAYDPDLIPNVHNKADIPPHQSREGVSFQFFRSLHNIVGFVSVEPGGDTHYHEHPWEQVVTVVEGATRFYIEPEEFDLEVGDIVFIPPSVEHELRPRDDSSCSLIDIWPLREEFIEHTAYQDEFERV